MFSEPWFERAKCLTVEDKDIFYPPRDKDLYKEIAGQAKAVCYGKDGQPPCPVRIDCLLYAERMDDQHGIFGGMSHRERNALKRKAMRKNMTLEQWVTNE